MRSAYFVCTTHRSGSTFFCEGLAAGGLGNPNEYFDDTLVPIWQKKWELPETVDHAAYLRQVVARQTTPNGIFGVKLMWHQTDLLRRMLQPLLAPDQPRVGLAKLLAAAFPSVRFVWLRRSDTIAQAVSLARAQQTGRWHSDSSTDWVGVAPLVREEKFDFAQIAEIQKNLLEWDGQWEKFFAKHPRLPVMKLVYEEFAPQYEQTMRDALAFLGHEDSAACDIPAPRHEKLADATSQTWKEQFLAQKAVAS